MPIPQKYLDRERVLELKRIWEDFGKELLGEKEWELRQIEREDKEK